MLKKTPLIALAGLVLLIGGCAAQNKPSQKARAEQRWNTARADVLYKLAKNQFESGNFEGSRKTVAKGLGIDHNHVPLHLLSAHLAIEQGQLELGERELADIRKIDPKNAKADYLSGIIYQRWQKPDIAYEFYTSASEKSPAELSYLLARSEMLMVLNRPEEALVLLRDKVAYFANSAVIRDAVGEILITLKQYDQAVPMFRQAAILSGNDPTIEEHLGLALYYAGQYPASASVLERVIKDEKYAGRSDLMTALGECQLRIGRFRDARDSFQSAVQANPSSAGIWLGLAKSQMQLDDLQRAAASLQHALTIDPKDGPAWLLRGYLELRQKHADEALTAFRRANAADRGDPVSLCMVGYTLQQLGRPSEARICYSAALKIKPNDDMASQLMAGLERHE